MFLVFLFMLNELKKNGSTKAPKKKRAPSEYNLFMGSKIKSLKRKSPNLTHTEVFAKAVDEWKKSKK